MIVPQALAFLLEINEQQVRAGMAEKVGECEKVWVYDGAFQSCGRGLIVFLSFSLFKQVSRQLEEHDPVRKLYWRYRLERVRAVR